MPLAALLLVSALVVPLIGNSRPQTTGYINPLFAELQTSANKLYTEGEIAKSAALYRKGYILASNGQDIRAEVRFLFGLGNCELANFQFRDALVHYKSAQKLAYVLQDREISGLLSVALYDLHSRMGDFPSALESMREAKRLLPAGGPPGNRARVLVTFANAESNHASTEASDRRNAERDFAQALSAAYEAGNPRSLAQVWSQLGYHYLRTRQLQSAERALDQAFWIRRMNNDADIADSYRSLGHLKFEQHDLESAEILLTLAIQAYGVSPLSASSYVPYYFRALTRRAQHDTAGAMRDFEESIRQASEWRSYTTAADAARTGADVWLDRIYSDYVATGMSLFRKNRDAALAASMFQVVEQGRAISLRERMVSNRDFPPEYWQKVAQLRNASIAFYRTRSLADRARIEDLRLQITESEGQFGIAGAAEGVSSTAQTGGVVPPVRRGKSHKFQISPRKTESILSEKSLEHIEQTLKDGEVLISFHLGEPASYIWVLTHGSFETHALPAAAEISGAVRSFRIAVQNGTPQASILGAALYLKLFGGLSRTIPDKPNWLLVLDDSLFELPFSSLVTHLNGGKPSYLIERNSLRILPAAATLAMPARRATSDRFVGVGDPVYNLADPRWKPVLSGFWLRSHLFIPGSPPRSSGPPEVTLARLPGSAVEIAVSAKAWAAVEPPVILTGTDTKRSSVEALIRTRPAVLHFATHIVQPFEMKDQALIAIGLDENGRNDFLSSAEIGSHTYQPGLVVLTGCSSGTGEALPGAGLFGLTRAWLLAGAQAVVSSHWPTVDDAGGLFEQFYRAYPSRKISSASAADALRRAQLAMLKSKDWRSNPRYWSAFFISGKD